jgi:hypothetical protein
MYRPSATSGKWYSLYRGGFLFDTSSLPDDATITSATLSLYGVDKADPQNDSPTVAVYAFTPASNTNIAIGDYSNFGATAYSNVLTYASLSTTGYTDFTLNSIGIAAINKTGISKFGTRNANYDVTGTSPTWAAGQNIAHWTIYHAEKGTGYQPKLVVTYTVLPTVTSQAATNVEETTATWNGNITNIGGSTVDYRGFAWDTVSKADPGDVAPASSGYTYQWYQGGSYGTGPYTYDVTTLTAGTTWYYRACAHNSYGWDYSNTEQTVYTKPGDPTDLVATAVSETQINLTWTAGSGSEKTMLRRKTASYPTDTTDGTQVYYDTGVSCNDTGLSTGVTYYYRAWAWDTNSGYSDGYAQATATTWLAGLNTVLWFQPTTMISGTTLPDREGTAQNGTITWGSNPTGIAVNIGALLPETAPITPASTEAGTPGFVPVTEVAPVITSGVEGTSFPLYGVFKGLLQDWRDLGGPNISMPYFWKLVAVVLGWMFGTAVMLTTRNIFFGIVAYFIGFAVPAGAMGGVLDLWVPIVYGLGALAAALLTAKWGASSL